MAARQHFVPQFYLNGFVDPSSKGSRNPYLWVVDLQNRTIRRKSPKNVAHTIGFYDWKEVKDRAPSIEFLYSQVEGRVAPIINKLKGHRFELSSEDRYNLSIFLGLQLTRVPRSRKASIDALSKSVQNRIRDLANDDEQLQTSLKIFNAKNERTANTLTVESIKDFINKKKFIIRPNPDYILQIILRSGLEFSRIMLTMNWLFVTTTQEECFFTSDMPVALLTPDGKPRKVDFESGCNPEPEIYFPISPSSILLLQHKAPENVVSVDADKVKEINRRIFPTIDRYAFCSSEQQGKWALEQRASRTNEAVDDNIHREQEE